MEEKSVKIEIPPEQLAKAVNKWLLPGLLRHFAQQKNNENKEKEQ